MKLHIKNMVCDRCKMVVKSELEQSKFNVLSIDLGEAEITETLNQKQLTALNERLQAVGFSLIDDRKTRVVEKTKNLIVALVHSQNNGLTTTLSQYLSFEIGQDYSSISHWFSAHEGTTIEQYYVLQRIERVKELLAYDELNLNEISDLLHYSSASHLSKQFKKVTSMTPSQFKATEQLRQPLDEV
jgi:YesN/AraC family two-component response regulator